MVQLEGYLIDPLARTIRYIHSVIFMITVMLCCFNYTWKKVLQPSRRSTSNCPYHDIDEFIYQVLLFLLRADLSNVRTRKVPTCGCVTGACYTVRWRISKQLPHAPTSNDVKRRLGLPTNQPTFV